MEAFVTAKAALLQALMSGPGYGLQLIERVRIRSNGAVSLGQGSVYPALGALQRDGLVESFKELPLPGRETRTRIIYALTTKGAHVVQQQRRAAAALFRVSTPLES